MLDAAVDLLIGGLLLSFQSVVRRLPHKHALKRVEGPRRLKDRRDSEKKGFNFKLSRIISLEFSYSTRFACLSDFLVESRRNYLGFESEIEMNHAP